MSSSDNELIERCRKGETRRFEELYVRYVKRVQHLVRRIVGSRTEPEDLTQEIFLQAYSGLGRFEGKSAFYTWLHRIACNVCLQFLRQRRRRPETLDLERIPDVASPDQSAPDPFDAVSRRELARKLEASLEQIRESQRVVLILGPIEGRSYEEMSRTMGVSIPIIKSRLHRARVNLRRLCQREASPVLARVAATAGSRGCALTAAGAV